MGIRFTQSKLSALASGDLSNASIHPIFVHLAHLYGVLLTKRDPDDVPSSLYPEEELSYLSIILDILRSSAAEAMDPVFRVRAHGLLGLYFYYKRDLAPARDQMGIAGRLIDNGQLGFGSIEGKQSSVVVAVGTSDGGSGGQNIGLMAALDEEDEKRSILAHLVYVDRSAQALMKSESQIPNRLDGEFMVLMVRSLPFVTLARIVYILLRSGRRTHP